VNWTKCVLQIWAFRGWTTSLLFGFLGKARCKTYGARLSEFSIVYNGIIKEVFGHYDDVLVHDCRLVPWCFGYGISCVLSWCMKHFDVCCESKIKDNIFATMDTLIQFGALSIKAMITCYKLNNIKAQRHFHASYLIWASALKMDLEFYFCAMERDCKNS